MPHKQDIDIETLLQEAANRKDIKSKAKTNTTAQDLRSQVLDHSVFMIEKLQKSIHNKDEDISAQQAKAYELLWPIIDNLISKTEDLKSIKAKNASEIILAVSQGRISLSEAKAMMELFKDQLTIEELPKIMEILNKNES